MSNMRVALYARYSSDLQRETSLDDQLRVCREYAEAQGWTVLPEHLYTDSGISGCSLDGRPGIQALLVAAERKLRPFDVVIAHDTSRVARDPLDALRVMQLLRFFGVRTLYLSQGFDSAVGQADTLVTIHGLVDGLYRTEMAAKIRRGQSGQLERGYATGGHTYSYRTIAVPNPNPSAKRPHVGKRVEIVPDEAQIVVQIFELYANGFGAARIVERLNREGCPPPRGERWQPGAVKRVLANEKYLGRLIWGQKTFERRPGTRQLVARPVPRTQWRVLERPDLRIVSEELWARVEARRHAVRAALPGGQSLMRGRNAALYSRHLFSGFMRCASCSGAVVVCAGGHGSPRYGCVRSWKNGEAACPNRLTIRAKVADAHLLEGLKAELLAPETVQYITEQCAAALNQHLDERPRELAETERARADVVQRLGRLIDSIEQGVAPEDVASRIRALKTELSRLDATVAGPTGRLPQRLAVMPASVRQQLENIVSVLQVSPERTKAEFQRLALQVTMARVASPGAPAFYRATVESDLPGLAGVADMPAARRGSAVDRFSASTVDRSLYGQIAPPKVRNLADFGVRSTVDRLDLR